MFFEKLGGEGPPPPTPHTPVPLPMSAPAPQPQAVSPLTLTVRQGSPPQVHQMPDAQLEQRDRQLLEALRAVYGDRLPFLPRP
jgi:hypothetical protein